MKKENIKFPVTYSLKTVMDNNVPADENKTTVNTILTKLNIPCSEWKTKTSSNNKYISFTVSVTVSSRTVFNDLYKLLSKQKEIKYVI